MAKRNIENISKFSALPPEQRPIQTLYSTEAIVPEESKQFLRHDVDRVQFPNGNEGWHHRVEINHGVMSAHIDDKDRVALVTNFRYPLGRYSTELPGGAVDQKIDTLLGVMEPQDAQVIMDLAAEQNRSILEFLGEDQLDEVLRNAAARELAEETGWHASPSDFRPLFRGPLFGVAGLVNMPQSVYYAHGGKKGQTNHDDGEAGMMTAKRVKIEDAADMVGHEIVEPATTTAIMALANMHGKKVPYLKSKKKRHYGK